MNQTIYSAKINNRFYRVVRRKSGEVQVWIDFPAGESCGWPECFYTGTIEGARQWWKANVSARAATSGQAH